MAKATESPPHEQLSRFEGQLKSAKKLPRITVIRGAEKWFHQEALAAMVAQAKVLGMQVNQYEASDPDYNPGGLFGDLTGGSLFGDPIFIVAREAGVLCKKNGTKESEFVTALKAYGQTDSPIGAALVLAPSMRHDHAVVKLAKSAGVVLNFRSLYSSPPSWKPDPRNIELVHWLRARAQHYDFSLRSEDAVYLAEAVGNDLGALDSELAKLSITGTAELRASVGWQSGGTPWEVADKLLGERLPEAVGAVESLFAKGFQGKDKKRVLDASALVAMLTGSLQKGVRIGLAVSEGQARGMSSEAVIEFAGIGGAPGTRKAALQRASRRTGSEWAAMLEALLDMERRFKTGGVADANDFVSFAVRFAPKRR